MADLKTFIEDDDLAAIQGAILEDPDKLDAEVDSSNNTPLMWSLTCRRPAIAHWLIQRGAKLDMQNDFGSTALMHACSNGQPDVARTLIRRGAKVDLQDNDGYSALMMACELNEPQIALDLIPHAALDMQTNEGWSALMFAAVYQQPGSGTAEMLIESGADLHLHNHEGWSALCLASVYAPETARTLIEFGAQLNHQDKKGWSALMKAVAFDQPETALLLINEGADLDLRNGKGATALILASVYGRHGAVAQALIDNDASLDVQTDEGVTALMAACGKMPEVALALIESGADVDVLSNSGRSALMLACIHGQSELVQALIEAGAELELQSRDGMTALAHACAKPESRITIDGQLRSVKHCWAAGASLHLPRKKKNFRSKVMSVLPATNSAPKNALHVAKANERKDIVNFMRFVTVSQVARILLEELGQSRHVVVAFYDAKYRSLASCAGLCASDFVKMGVDPNVQRRLWERLTTGPEPQHESLPKPEAVSPIKVLRRLSGSNPAND